MTKTNSTMAVLAIALVLAFAFPFSFASAAVSCGDLDANGKKIVCDNGSPENVVSAWGATNSQLPHVAPGVTVTDAAGMVSVCPSWFSVQFYCVDISNTDYYKNGQRDVARKLQAGGFALGSFAYWLTH